MSGWVASRVLPPTAPIASGTDVAWVTLHSDYHGILQHSPSAETTLSDSSPNSVSEDRSNHVRSRNLDSFAEKLRRVRLQWWAAESSIYKYLGCLQALPGAVYLANPSGSPLQVQNELTLSLKEAAAFFQPVATLCEAFGEEIAYLLAAKGDLKAVSVWLMQKQHRSLCTPASSVNCTSSPNLHRPTSISTIDRVACGTAECFTRKGKHAYLTVCPAPAFALALVCVCADSIIHSVSLQTSPVPTVCAPLILNLRRLMPYVLLSVLHWCSCGPPHSSLYPMV